MAPITTPLEALLAELANEIANDEADLQKRIAAIDEKRAAHRYLQARATNPSSPPVSAAKLVQMQDAATPQRRLAVTEAINIVVNGMSGSDIYVAPVYDALVEMNVEMPTNVREARIRVGTQLNRLVKKGVLTKTFNGSGNVPNRYRLKGDASDLA